MNFYPGLEVLATAVSLSMDAFSVSLCMGICCSGLSLKQSAEIASAFGFFQFAMPLIGALAASGLAGVFSDWAGWIGFAMIAYVGVNMIRESFSDASCDCSMAFGFKNLIILSVATSLDALAVGFSLQFTHGGALPLAVWSGVSTFALCLPGARVGWRLGEKLGSRAELFGGIVLCAIAVKVLMSSL
ncbi:MAG: manganese efflux pump MntP family protein [Pyramidobacter sp.]|nr:manganese efflux pump MntP family protein [Pyramidobacter sp.]